MILIAIVGGVATVYNYSRSESQIILIHNLGDEFETEVEYVLDYVIANGLGNDEIENFTDDFYNYTGHDKELYVLFGEKDNLIGYKYSNETKQTFSFTEDGDSISFTIGDMRYEFTERDGKNFYYVLAQDINNEKHVATSTMNQPCIPECGVGVSL